MIRAVLVSVVAASLLLCAVGAAAFFLVPDRTLKDLIEWGVERTTGQVVAIDFLQTRRGIDFDATLNGVKFGGNNDRALTVNAETVLASFKLMDVFASPPRLRKVTVEGAQITRPLAKNRAEGHQGVSANPQELIHIPLRIDALELREIDYRDPRYAGQEALVLFITEAEGKALPGSEIGITGEGSYKNETFRFEIVSISDTESDGLPVTASIDGVITGKASTHIGQDGQLGPVAFEASGPTLAALSVFTPLPMPETPPFSISGTARLSDALYEVTDLDGKIGDSDIAGSVTTDLSGETPSVSGRLVSRFLDFDDLAPLVGGTPDPSESASAAQRARAGSGPLVPDTKIQSDKLKSLSLDIEFVASEVSAPLTQIESINAHVRLSDARLELKPLHLGVSGGSAAGEIALNLREATPSADIGMTFSGVELTKFINNRFADETGGQLSGSIYFLGTGNSIKEMLGTARGQGLVRLREGRVSALIVEAAGADVIESLGVMIAGDSALAMPCAAIAMSAEEGTLTVSRAEALTSDSLVYGAARVDLDELSYVAQVESKAWDFSLLDLRAPVRITGTGADFRFSLGRSDEFPLFKRGADVARGCDALFERVKPE